MAQINPNAYPTAYKISHVDSDGTTPLDIEFSYDLATLVIEDNISMETVMDGSNSYAGFDASIHNYWVGGSIYGRAQGNPNDPAYGGVSWSSHQVENPKQNLRWFLKITGGSGNSQGANPVRWTPQLDDDELTPTYNPNNEQSMTSVMTNSEIRLREGGVYSNFYTMYPITKIDLDKIQLYPAFTVIRYAFTYNEDDLITGVSSTTTRYHWNDVKPEDNTAAGSNYNFDLWKYGFYDEMDSENPTHIKYRYVVDSCYVEQYYWSGKRSASGSAKLSMRIDNSAWDYSGDAVLPGNTGYNTKYGYLVPFSEGVFNVGGVSGVMINPISGLIFGGSATSLNRAISFDSSKNNSMYYTDVNGQGTTMIASSTTAGTGFTLKNDENDMTASSVLISRPFGALFGSATSPDYDAPAHYETRDNGSIIHVAQTSGNRNVISLTIAPFPIEQLWQALASLGVYIVGTSSIPSGDFTLGQDFPSWLYHGEVLEDGTTTGVMIQGEDIEDLPNWNEIDYEPVIPTPTPPTPGGDDNSETGDKIPNQFGRNVGVTSNFITQYLMTQGQISKLGEVLWTSWADDTVTMDMVENFYGKLHDTTGSWNVSSALQFLVSCRMFPMSLATLVGTTATTSIPIGTGAFALQCGTASEPTFFIANESVAVLNCGDVYVPKEFGDYRDFDNTNITAYLPYCGSVQLSPQDVVGKWLGCTYAIDLFDGSCKAFMYILSGDDVGYQGAYYNVAIKEGQCGFLIPMSATQAGEVASRRKVDSYIDGSMLFNAGSTMLDGTMRIASGDGLGAIGADVSRLANLGFAYNTLSAQRMGRAGIAAPTIAGGSGFADFMQPASPYIQIRRSRYQLPIQYENSVAYPTNAQNYGNLSQFTGFVQCKNVDVHGFTCHEEERSAIKALLESGVYL